MKYITKKDAIKMFLKEHKDYLIVDYSFVYGLGRKKQVKKDSKKYLDRYKKVKKLRNKRLTLREIALDIGGVSHEMVRLILKK